ncbi:MAG: hypothetical protein ABR548_01560, partial [Actinomycetota bacterium]
ASAHALFGLVSPRPTLVFVALPEAEARILLAAHGGSFAVGVYPDSRDAQDFWVEVSAGAPREREGIPSPLAGRECLLAKQIRESHRDRPGLNPDFSQHVVAQGEPVEALAALRAVFCAPDVPADAQYPIGAPLAVAVPTATMAEPVIKDVRDVIVFGVAAKTPLVIGTIGEGHGVLEGGIARRPGVVTPYDVTATILQRTSTPIPSSGVIGHVLHVRSRPNPLAYTKALAARFERDAGFGPTVAGITIGFLAGAGIVVTGFLLIGGLHALALRSARGAAAAVIGYVASLFVPSGNAWVRGIPIVALYVAGAAARVRTPERVRIEIGRLLGVAALAIGVLTITAALRPGGEPALSLWGDPVESWRFFGLRNHLTSMLQLGAITGVALSLHRPSPAAAAVAGACGALIIGLAQLGANFVAVFTLVFGAGLVTYVLWRGLLSIQGIVLSGVAGTLAFIGALLADAGSPVSHGGRAVQRVRAGGVHAAYDFLAIRWRLNIAEIRSLWGGWVWAAGLLIGLVAIFLWAMREDLLTPATRAVLIGGSAAALAALFMEDTGFLAGGIIALAPGLVAATAVVEMATRPRPALDVGERGRLRLRRPARWR